LVAPKDVPKDAPEPEAAKEEAEEDEGEDGGQEGGVKGGVVGGVVGAPAPPPPKPTGPAQLSMKAGHMLLKINPNVAPYRPRIAEQYVREGEELVANLYVCVGKDGRVRNARITRGTVPPVDLQITKSIQTWLYKPYLVNGQPAEFCYPLVYKVQ
jgi:protein TonB